MIIENLHSQPYKTSHYGLRKLGVRTIKGVSKVL